MAEVLNSPVKNLFPLDQNILKNPLITPDQRRDHEVAKIFNTIKHSYKLPKIVKISQLSLEDEVSKPTKTLPWNNKESIPNLPTLSKTEDFITSQLYENIEAVKLERSIKKVAEKTTGFFSKINEPYREIGKVYTSTPELMKNTLVSDILNKVYRKSLIKEETKDSQVKDPESNTSLQNSDKTEKTANPKNNKVTFTNPIPGP